jgi:hypothetical protein
VARPEPTLEELPWRVAVRRARRKKYVNAVVVAVIVLVAATALYELVVRPLTASKPVPAPVSIVLGAPSLGTLRCGTNTTLSTERIPWSSTNRPVTTANLAVEITELDDGSVIGGTNPAAFATASNECTGDPPTGAHEWYAVLQSPDGTNVASFSYSASWVAVGGSPLPLTVQNDSALVLLSTSTFAASGYVLELYDPVSGPTVTGSSAL